MANRRQQHRRDGGHEDRLGQTMGSHGDLPGGGDYMEVIARVAAKSPAYFAPGLS